MHLHAYHMYYLDHLVLVPSQASNVLCRLALVLEIETLTAEAILCAQRKERFVLGVLVGGHVACEMEM
jgi:hypothetical protein